ncbi:Spy/CpxP family protein refolding chaperone [Candidatus Mycalebacterium sp.]
MSRKTILYVASAVFCAVVFSPSFSLANEDCPYSKKGGEKSFRNKITGGDKEHGGKSGCHKGKYGHGKYGHKKYGHGKHGMGAFWWRSADMAERLRLSDGQIAQLDEIAASSYEEIADAYEKGAEAKHRFKKVMKNPDSSADEIKAAAKKKYAAMTEKKSARLEMLLAMRDVLTPEQRKDLSVLKHKRRKGCGFEGKSGRY